LNTHSELRELEDGGKASSVAPSGNSETPQPSAPRIKIISSSAKKEEANGNGTSDTAPKQEE
jgi:ATP-dependent helicase STH1/SNF2